MRIDLIVFKGQLIVATRIIISNKMSIKMTFVVVNHQFRIFNHCTAISKCQQFNEHSHE